MKQDNSTPDTASGEALTAEEVWERRDLKHQTVIDELEEYIQGGKNEPQTMSYQIGYLRTEMISLLDDSNTLHVSIQKELDNIWDVVRPDTESWDYPAQITRYVREQAQQLALANERIQQLEASELAVGGLVETVEFYADHENYDRDKYFKGSAIGDDMGQRAREALAAYEASLADGKRETEGGK